jgi:TonB-dependent SusC/RagA subfamily outer membrane receptor
VSRTSNAFRLCMEASVVTTLLLAVACSKKPQTAVAPETPTPDSVNVGYGRQSRDNVTGAVSSVSGDEARRPKPTSVAEMLQGRFPGVEVTALPGGGLSVRIRGTRSFMGGNEPLYVIDGIPVPTAPGGVLLGLDPGDIKSIEVLKDAGATAAYGSRGANGVILISTKRSR